MENKNVCENHSPETGCPNGFNRNLLVGVFFKHSGDFNELVAELIMDRLQLSPIEEEISGDFTFSFHLLEDVHGLIVVTIILSETPGEENIVKKRYRDYNNRI